MTLAEMFNLRNGDIITNLGSGESYIVTLGAPGPIVAIRSVTVTNPPEWKLHSRSKTVEDTSHGD